MCNKNDIVFFKIFMNLAFKPNLFSMINATLQLDLIHGDFRSDHLWHSQKNLPLVGQIQYFLLFDLQNLPINLSPIITVYTTYVFFLRHHTKNVYTFMKHIERSRKNMEKFSNS